MKHPFRLYTDRQASAQLAELGIIDHYEDEAPKALKDAIIHYHLKIRNIREEAGDLWDYPSNEVLIDWPDPEQDDPWLLKVVLEEASQGHVVIYAVHRIE